MNITFVRMYRNKDIDEKFYNLQEVGLAKAFLKQEKGINVNILILSGETNKIIRKEIQEGISLYIVPAKGIGHHGKLDCSILSNLSTDIVHLQSDNMLFAPKVIRYCLKHQIKCHNYIGTVNSDSPHRLKKFLMFWIACRNCRWYKRIPTFAKTSFVEKELKCMGVKNAKVAPVGLDLSVIPEISDNKEEIRKKLELPLKNKLVLFVGRLEVYKNPIAAIHVIEKLPERYLLIMIGEGILEKRIDREVEKRGLNQKVIRVGKIANTEVHKYYRACDIYINLNPHEIYGMAILEAMYQGMPVYAIHAPGPNFILKEGYTGFLCDSLEDMNKKIVETENRTEDIGNAAREEILKNFQWENTADIIRYW